MAGYTLALTEESVYRSPFPFLANPCFLYIYTQKHTLIGETHLLHEREDHWDQNRLVRERFQDVKWVQDGAPKDRNVWQKGECSWHQSWSLSTQLLLDNGRYLLLKVQILLTSLAPESSQYTASALDKWCEGWQVDNWKTASWNDFNPLSLSTPIPNLLLIKYVQTWKIWARMNGQWYKLHEKTSRPLLMTQAQKDCAIAVNVPELRVICHQRSLHGFHPFLGFFTFSSCITFWHDAF